MGADFYAFWGFGGGLAYLGFFRGWGKGGEFPPFFRTCGFYAGMEDARVGADFWFKMTSPHIPRGVSGERSQIVTFI